MLSKYDILLLPYSNKVYVRSKSIETSQYMSPLKLFDYMASKKIIVASKMNVYRHILNKKNSILIESGSSNLWANKIENIFNNLFNEKIQFEIILNNNTKKENKKEDKLREHPLFEKVIDKFDGEIIR